VRPYARDVFKNRRIREVMEEPRIFDSKTNLFSVAEEINTEMKKPGISFFVLTNEDEEFNGIFSTQDMLVYLSEMTQNDIALARKLQARIVREREFVVGNTFEFTASSQTAKGVGGDFYDIRRYGDDRWAAAFCDVSGKGIAASIVTSVIWGIMSTYDFRRGLTNFVKELNDYIVRTFESERFITGIFLSYNEVSQELEICDMGHSHLYLFRKGRFVKIKNSQNNLPIGVVPDFTPRSNVIKPREQDLLFLLTDGLTEQENEDGEPYSIDRVASILREHHGVPVETTCDRLLTDFHSFRGHHALGDDVTFALLRFVRQEVML
jgi:sigma-B regulation protein RsbU (phosphoserine phosphatase)